MHILVFGASGLLGSNIVTQCLSRDHKCTGTYKKTEPSLDVPTRQLDLRNPGQIRDVLGTVSPDVVVNCAAMTDVDSCESDPEKAHAINADSPGMFASICSDYNIEVVHVSTDYVFDGRTDEPYTEDATVDPIQVYGKSKAKGEQLVHENVTDALIIRPSFVYGVHRGVGELTGFPVWVRDQLLSGTEVPLFTDQYVTPSRAGSTAETILDLIEIEASGLFHVTCCSCVTPYEFGEQLCQQLGASEDLLVKTSMMDVERDAQRPSYTCLAVKKVEKLLERPQPTLAEDLHALENTLTV